MIEVAKTIPNPSEIAIEMSCVARLEHCRIGGVYADSHDTASVPRR
jgi:hypothetical protein